MAGWRWCRSRRGVVAILGLASILGIGQAARAADGATTATEVTERGRIALTLHGYLRPAWSDDAYKKARRFWGPGAPDPDTEPERYAAAFRERYGLHPAPYPNDGLPMGLRKGVLPDGTRRGIQVDCLLCHGGSIGGKSHVGLGNTQLDLTRLFEELTRADGRRFPLTPYVINSARGTNNAGMFSAVLLSLRNTDLSFRKFPLPLGANLPEMDTIAWWNYGPKSTMYYDGRTPADSTRSMMQFLLGEKSRSEFEALEPTFREIQAYLRSITPPKYPFAIDQARAEQGRRVFENRCSKCHGTYGENPSYPNEIVALKVIGTDPSRATGMSDRMIAHYNATWFATEHPADPVMTGYQAPPLRGIWATAPYLHNGSVPTLRHLLRSGERPARFLRPPSTEFEHYDQERVGWKSPVVTDPGRLSPEEKRRFFDASRFGLGNGGHTFGDALGEADLANLIEYLKTL
ncbi:MAG: c-type cytochrome [Isosphaeraceae bacterium]